jgi:hypothetical protein
VTDPQSQLEALADRLQSAAARLKAAADGSPDEPASPEPSLPARSGPDGMSAVLERLEAAGAAVRDARARLAELQQQLDAG